MNWLTDKWGYGNGPERYVSNEEIDARFRGGRHLVWFKLTWTFREIAKIFKKLLDSS